MSAARAVVIGVGNEYRRDDGAGLEVAARVSALGLDGVAVLLCDGEPARLLRAWARVPLAILVDACLADPPAPGRVHRIEPGAPDPRRESRASPPGRGLVTAGLASTHGLGPCEALELAEITGSAPGRLVVFAVEAASTSAGQGLSGPVAAAVPAVVTAVLAELAPIWGTSAGNGLTG